MPNTTVPAANTGSPIRPPSLALADLRIIDSLDSALARLHALQLAIEALHIPDENGANALTWIAGEALDAVTKIRDDLDERRLSMAAA